MASLILHEIIGEIYCEKNNIIDRTNFLSGNIAPDTLPTDKDENHYTTTHNYSIYLDAIKGRVNLTRFCKEDNIDTTYRKGYFLHLVTDYIFYDRGMYFLFFTVFGMGSSLLRISRNQHDDRLIYYSDMNPSSSATDVKIG